MSLSTVEAFKHIEASGNLIELDDKKLHQLQLVLTEMVRDFDSFCRNNNIEYSLGGGSCLGAVRHKGLIPWDDDVDINLSRKDFELLRGSFDKQMGSKYYLQVPGETPDYELGLGRIRLRGTTLRSREDFEANPGSDECGVYIDLFVFENTPDGKVARAWHGLVSLFLGFALSCRRFAKYKQEYLSFAGDNKSFVRTIKIKALCGKLFSFKSAADWCAAWDRWNSRVTNENSMFITAPVGRRHYFGELIKRGDYFPSSTGEFEGISVELPRDPSLYLSTLYGPDYMQIPPVEKRETHVVLSYDLGRYSQA